MKLTNSYAPPIKLIIHKDTKLKTEFNGGSSFVMRGSILNCKIGDLSPPDYSVFTSYHSANESREDHSSQLPARRQRGDLGSSAITQTSTMNEIISIIYWKISKYETSFLSACTYRMAG